jgi:hypothetical protein
MLNDEANAQGKRIKIVVAMQYFMHCYQPPNPWKAEPIGSKWSAIFNPEGVT